MVPSRSNSIRILLVFNRGGVWLVEDPVSHLREALCCGAAEVVNAMTADIRDQDGGCSLIFSDAPFPGATMTLTRLKLDESGNRCWYHAADVWGQSEVTFLCCETLKHFEAAPETIHVRVDALPVGTGGWN